MSTMTNNGRVTRKTLASQLDRLDTILDCLADGLNEAVATAVREAVGIAVQQAVQAVLTEILTNPEVLAKLQTTAGLQTVTVAQPVAEARKPSWREQVQRMQSWISTKLRRLCQVCFVVSQRLYNRSANLWNRMQVVRQFKGPLLLALGVGVLVGVTAYFAGPWLSALVSGMGGFVTTLAVQGGLWLRRMGGAMPRIEA